MGPGSACSAPCSRHIGTCRRRLDTFDDLLEFIGDVLGEGKKSEKLARWHESHESANQRGTSETLTFYIENI